MTTLTDFPITAKWPPSDPGKIQLYSSPTANGVKASIALEELGLPYEAHRVSLGRDVTTPEFLSLNPNNKIPAMIDPDGPDGEPVPLFESGAILIYLADKTGQLLPKDTRGRYQAIQWLMFQMGGIGPMFGQLGFFNKQKGSEIEDPRPRQRYIDEAKRLLAVVDGQLEGRAWINGEFSIADIAIAPWLRALDGYDAREVTGWFDHANAVAYLDRFLDRPAVQRGLTVPPRD